MEKPNTTPLLMLFILLGVIMPLIFYTADSKIRATNRNYTHNGRLVTCTVTYVSRFFNMSSVSAVYLNERNRNVTGYAVLNRPMSEGDTFEGYVLPDEGYKIFSPRDNVPKNVSQGSIIITTVMGWLFFIAYLLVWGNYNLLAERGKETDAELMSVERWDNSTLFGSFRFADDAGKMKTVKLYISRNLADVYETYRICYYIMPNGKIEAATADERLQK